MVTLTAVGQEAALSTQLLEHPQLLELLEHPQLQSQQHPQQVLQLFTGYLSSAERATALPSTVTKGPELLVLCLLRSDAITTSVHTEPNNVSFVV